LVKKKDVGERCPVGKFLLKKYSREIKAVGEKLEIGPSVALCGCVCPAVLGTAETAPDGRCVIRLRFLKLF
jgi:hypothetical protein